jgi:hypothetical protein
MQLCEDRSVRTIMSVAYIEIEMYRVFKKELYISIPNVAVELWITRL